MAEVPSVLIICGQLSSIKDKMNIVELIIDIVATYRLTKLIMDDKITEKFRDMVFDKYPPRTSMIGFLLTCPWCVSIWSAGAIFLIRRLDPTFANYISGALTASAVTGIAYERGL